MLIYMRELKKKKNQWVSHNFSKISTHLNATKPRTPICQILCSSPTFIPFLSYLCATKPILKHYMYLHIYTMGGSILFFFNKINNDNEAWEAHRQCMHVMIGDIGWLVSCK